MHYKNFILDKPFNPFHFVKIVRIQSYSNPHFPTFGLNLERYLVYLRIQSECGKMRTRMTPNMTPNDFENVPHFIGNKQDNINLKWININGVVLSSVRSSHWRFSLRKGVFKNFVNFTEKVLEYFLIKLQAFRPVFKQITSFKNTSFEEHLQTTASFLLHKHLAG